jgi:hypothetical protein
MSPTLAMEAVYSKLDTGADGDLVINNRKVGLSELRNRYFTKDGYSPDPYCLDEHRILSCNG